MASNINPIPGNMTVEEASEFWDAHDVADYPSHVVQFDYTPEEWITFVTCESIFKSIGATGKRERNFCRDI